MDGAAEAVATADLARRWSLRSHVEVGLPEFERVMWSLSVGVVDVDAEHAFEVAAVEDQQARLFAVSDEKQGVVAAYGEVETEVARLLGDPGAGAISTSG